LVRRWRILIEYQYETRPKFEHDHSICCCKKEDQAPTKGQVDFQTEKGFTITKNMFWCKNCGLALSFAQMDQMGDTWDEIRSKANKTEALRKKKEKTLEFPY
jgi:hypothetical protein